MSVAIEQDDGEYGAVVVSGANLGIDAAALAADWASLWQAKVLLLQNEVPEAVNLAAARGRQGAQHDGGAQCRTGAGSACRPGRSHRRAGGQPRRGCHAVGREGDETAAIQALAAPSRDVVLTRARTAWRC